MTAVGECGWCRRPLDATARRDSRYCSQRCRQASHRFTVATRRAELAVDASGPIRVAYADPPYPQCAARYYGDHPDFEGEVDHVELIRYLSQPGRFDGWALSTNARSLPAVLGICASLGVQVKVAAWVRGARPNRAARGPVNGWEPVVYTGGRDGWTGHRTDTLTYAARARTTDPARVVGAKPAVFCRWVFELLGAMPGDEFHDLFPGSGGVGRAWEIFAGPGASCVAGGYASRSADDGTIRRVSIERDVSSRTSCGDVSAPVARQAMPDGAGAC